MNKKKKELPLTIWKALEKYVNLKGKEIEIVDSGTFLLKVIENDNEPVFYFNPDSAIEKKYYFWFSTSNA